MTAEQRKPVALHNLLKQSQANQGIRSSQAFVPPNSLLDIASIQAQLILKTKKFLYLQLNLDGDFFSYFNFTFSCV